MKVIIVASSLNPGSNSRKMAQQLQKGWESDADLDVQFVDLRDYPIPLCGGDEAWGDPNVAKLGEIFEKADAVVFAVPIYNFDVNAALKNVIEFNGRKLSGKLAGFLCAAGGQGSYMSIMAFANSLMLDFRVVILPRFVYATGDAFEGDSVDTEIAERIEKFGEEFKALAGAVNEIRPKDE
ncbi:MAG: NAD(P)H-dependent oxidoreductase [Verrucomicrobiota bacterium]